MIVYYRIPDQTTPWGAEQRFSPAIVTKVHGESCVDLLLLLGDDHPDVDRHATKKVTSASRGVGVNEWRLSLPGAHRLVAGSDAGRAADADAEPVVVLEGDVSAGPDAPPVD